MSLPRFELLSLSLKTASDWEGLDSTPIRGDTWERVLQQFEPFAVQFFAQNCQSCRIATWMREAHGDPILHRKAKKKRNDWNRRGRLFRASTLGVCDVATRSTFRFTNSAARSGRRSGFPSE